MGMFDYIENQLYCPFCGCLQDSCSFQTKNFNNCMTKLDVLKIRGVDYEFYTTCKNCNNWINLNVLSHMGIHTEKEGKKQILKRQKELSELFKTKKTSTKKKSK